MPPSPVAAVTRRPGDPTRWSGHRGQDEVRPSALVVLVLEVPLLCARALRGGHGHVDGAFCGGGGRGGRDFCDRDHRERHFGGSERDFFRAGEGAPRDHDGGPPGRRALVGGDVLHRGRWRRRGAALRATLVLGVAFAGCFGFVARALGVVVGVVVAYDDAAAVVLNMQIVTAGRVFDDDTGGVLLHVDVVPGGGLRDVDVGGVAFDVDVVDDFDTGAAIGRIPDDYRRGRRGRVLDVQVMADAGIAQGVVGAQDRAGQPIDMDVLADHAVLQASDLDARRFVGVDAPSDARAAVGERSAGFDLHVARYFCGRFERAGGAAWDDDALRFAGERAFASRRRSFRGRRGCQPERGGDDRRRKPRPHMCPYPNRSCHFRPLLRVAGSDRPALARRHVPRTLVEDEGWDLSHGVAVTLRTASALDQLDVPASVLVCRAEGPIAPDDPTG